MNEPRFHGFTLVELVIVVAILAILTLVALPNFLLAKQRALQARCAGNLKAIAYALYAYRLDLNHYPLADGTAGTMESMGQTEVGNGPAANGSWDGVPAFSCDLATLRARKSFSARSTGNSSKASGSNGFAMPTITQLRTRAESLVAQIMWSGILTTSGSLGACGCRQNIVSRHRQQT